MEAALFFFQWEILSDSNNVFSSPYLLDYLLLFLSDRYAASNIYKTRADPPKKRRPALVYRCSIDQYTSTLAAAALHLSRRASMSLPAGALHTTTPMRRLTLV